MGLWLCQQGVVGTTMRSYHPGLLGYMGDEIFPSYMNHYKDTGFLTNQDSMERHKDFDHSSHVCRTLNQKSFPKKKHIKTSEIYWDKYPPWNKVRKRLFATLCRKISKHDIVCSFSAKGIYIFQHICFIICFICLILFFFRFVFVYSCDDMLHLSWYVQTEPEWCTCSRSGFHFSDEHQGPKDMRWPFLRQLDWNDWNVTLPKFNIAPEKLPSQ